MISYDLTKGFTNIVIYGNGLTLSSVTRYRRDCEPKLIEILKTVSQITLYDVTTPKLHVKELMITQTHIVKYTNTRYKEDLLRTDTTITKKITNKRRITKRPRELYKVYN